MKTIYLQNPEHWLRISRFNQPLNIGDVIRYNGKTFTVKDVNGQVIILHNPRTNKENTTYYGYLEDLGATVKVTKNPYKSKAQQRLFHALAAKGKISSDIVTEYDKESAGLDLPEKVSNPTTRKALEDNIKKRVYNFGYRENFDNTPPFTEKRAEMLISDIKLAGFKPTLTISELMRIYKTGLEDYHDLYD